MNKEIKYGRVLDPRTMTYAYSDGSGRVTAEQCVERDLLKSRIQELEATGSPSKGDSKAHFVWVTAVAGLKFRFLTYFSGLSEENKK